MMYISVVENDVKVQAPWPSLLWLAAWPLVACAGGGARAPTQSMAPLAMSAPPATATSAPVTSPAVASPAPASPVPDACRGVEFDLDALPDRCSARYFPASTGEVLDAEKGSAPDLVDAPLLRLDAKLVMASPRVRSGETLDVRLVFANTTTHAILVDIPEGLVFELGAYDARGARLDRIVEGCNFGRLCSPLPSRVLLGAGGTITDHLSFIARIVHATKATECEDRTSGGLPPGKYELRAMILPGCGLTPNGPAATAPLGVH